jgi:F-type H+-transporting ATPase subunit delta
VTNRTAATRYARALLDVAAKEQADLARIGRDLSAFAALVRDHPDLGKVLVNPAVPTARKRAAVERLVTESSVSPIVAKLLVLLAQRDRLVLLKDLAASYEQQLLDYLRVVRAEVTTAAPIDADRVRQIEASLARATGRTVNLTTRVDPALIGGLVARVGSTIYDASVTTHLRRLKQRLEESM